MIKWSWIIVLFLISCNSKIKKEVTSLTFVEKSLLKDSVDIDLPVFEHGLPFFEDDSTTYLNIYLINDSTVQVGKDIFNLKSEVIKYGNKIVDSRRFNLSAVGDTIADRIDRDTATVNIFIDKSVHYELLSRLFQHIASYWDRLNKKTNFIDGNNNILEIRNSRRFVGCGVMINVYDKNVFEINIDITNNILIENEKIDSLNEISIQLKEWYTNPLKKKNLPIWETATLEKYVKILKEINEEYNQVDYERKGYLSQKITEFERKIKIIKLIGSYSEINKYSAVHININNKTYAIDYLSILDRLNKGLLELRNELCLKKFDMEYSKLNLSLTREAKIKEAIDVVYPNLIYPNFRPPPPPPDPPPFWDN